MSAPPAGNRRRKGGAPRAIQAPADPITPGDDSPLPGAATTTLRPPRAASSAGGLGRIARGLQLVAGVAVVLSASIAVAWGARRYVTSSPRFAIHTVLVEGERKRSAAQIADAGGVAPGKNIFALDLVAAGQMLEQDPWIERATVTRKLPSTVSISVVEREAYALTAINGELYLATRDGELFKRLTEGDPADLPLVTGITAEQVARDRPGVVIAVKRVLDVAADLDRASVAKRYPLEELHLEKDGSLVLTIGREAIAVHLGQPPYRDKIEQLARVLAEVARRKATAQVIFLDNDAHPERVVVRMR